jgi:hypothetical protein
VDGIEDEFKGQLIVLRVNIQDPAIRTLADQYKFEYTPTFIFFNPQGEEVWRTIGSVDVQKIRDSLP